VNGGSAAPPPTLGRQEGGTSWPPRCARYLPALEPNVIPFIDVLLVLLIIFMVTAPKPTTDLRVDLPRSGRSAASAIPPTMVEVLPSQQGFRLRVGGQDAAMEELGQQTLAHVLAATPALTPDDARAEARIHVRADPDVAYEHVVATIETLQQARFRKVGLLAPDLADDAEPA
jgi:biopolymer transport protein ExbD